MPFRSNVKSVIMGERQSGDRLSRIQRCHAAHGTRSLYAAYGSYHSCLDEMEFASAGTASAEGLRMDSKEAPEDEEGLKAQGNFLPLSSETPSSFVDRVRTSAALLCTNWHGAETHSDRARAQLCLSRISPAVGRQASRRDDDI